VRSTDRCCIVRVRTPFHVLQQDRPGHLRSGPRVTRLVLRVHRSGATSVPVHGVIGRDRAMRMSPGAPCRCVPGTTVARTSGQTRRRRSAAT
jgi:hypothetical protein